MKKFIKNLIGRFYISKNRKELLNELAHLINSSKRVASECEVQEAFNKLMEYKRKIKDGDSINIILGQLIDFLIDTKYHARKGYHKPHHNGWKTLNKYPDINDYVKLGAKISQF